MCFSNLYTSKLLLLSLTVFGLFAGSCKKQEQQQVQEQVQEQVQPSNPKIDKLKLPVGFRAEHLYSPGENDQGSWVAMTFDHKGRMITSDQYGSLYRLDLPVQGDTTAPKVEMLVIGKEAYQNPDTSTIMIGMGLGLGLL